VTDWWSGFERDPRDAGTAGLRASDADRDVVRGLLSEAFADGRLDREEFDERSDAVTEARILGDLPVIVRDLVPLTPPVRRPAGLMKPEELQAKALERWRHDRREAFFGMLFVSAVTWTIYLATSFPGFPWPAFVTLAALFNLLKVASSREQKVAENVRYLEKKQAKELYKRGELPPS
jgi:hypothetical protein